MSLHERIAAALGWTVAEAQSFSLVALRELLGSKLGAFVTDEIKSGRVLCNSHFNNSALRSAFYDLALPDIGSHTHW